MTRYSTVNEVLRLYRQVMDRSGGTVGILSMDALESAVAQPRATFDDHELYASIIEKAAALGYSLVMNHPFVDGNKRIGHAAMELFLVLNGFEIVSEVEEQEKMFSAWLRETLGGRVSSAGCESMSKQLFRK